MKYLITTALITAFVLLSGFTVVTPEMKKERAELCEKIIKIYGEQSLNDFVNYIIESGREVDGTALGDSSLSKNWLPLDWNPFWYIQSGDWALVTEGEKGEKLRKFTLFWLCDENEGIFIEGTRERSGKLVLEKIWKEEVVEINWM